VEKEPVTGHWVVPTSGTYSFSFSQYLSQSLADVAQASEKNAQAQSASEAAAYQLRTAGLNKKCARNLLKHRKPEWALGARGGEEMNANAVYSESPRIQGTFVRKATNRGSFLQMYTAEGMEQVVDWTEIDTLLIGTWMPVTALAFATIRGMFLSLITQAQQLRFLRACSRDMSFNYAQVCRLCKDRPEVVPIIITSLFPSIASTSSQLMLLGTLQPLGGIAPAISQELSPCLWFQTGNLTGRYCLDLEKPAQYVVADHCLVCNAWEAEVACVLKYPDVSQRGNCEMLRNEVYNQAAFTYARDWALPSTGVWHLDFSSIRRSNPGTPPSHEAMEVTRNVNRSSASLEAKIRALRAVSTHLHLSTHQFKNLILIFPAGTLRQDFFCMFHTRVVDPDRFLGPELLHNPNIFSHEDRAALIERVGTLHLLNPLRPEGVEYHCDLSVREQRRIAEFLVELATEEPQGKVLATYGKKTVFGPLPAHWEKHFPEEGVIVVCYETTSINMPMRRILARKYCIGVFA